MLMIVLQDLRVWTIFRAEVAHFKTQHVAYRKTGLEWEILGDLGLRLHHKEEAKEVCPMFCVPNPYAAHILVFFLHHRLISAAWIHRDIRKNRGQSSWTCMPRRAISSAGYKLRSEWQHISGLIILR